MWGGDERFSEATKAALIEVAAETWTHKDLNLLFRRLEVDDSDEREFGNPTKIHRVEGAVDQLASRGPEHGRDLLELIRTLIEERWQGDVPDAFLSHNAAARRLMEGLRTDGWELAGTRLVASNPDEASIAEEISLLEKELKARGWDVALTHYRQAITNYRDSEFESSNGQLRNVLDDTLARACAEKTGKAGRDPKGCVDRLVNAKVLTNDEAQMIKGLVGISNTNGPHPGLSNAAEALFRLHVVVATVRWLLAIV